MNDNEIKPSVFEYAIVMLLVVLSIIAKLLKRNCE